MNNNRPYRPLTRVPRHNTSRSCIHINQDELRIAPYITNDATNPDANNGLITRIWGPSAWEAFHSTTFGYPINPSKEQKHDYYQYFVFMGKVLPCEHCRVSYQKFITDGDTVLDIDTMGSRETLTKWGYRIHNRVNKKLGVDYGDTYEEMCYKYESYRARCTDSDKGCIVPLSISAKPCQKADIHRAPIIDKKYSYCLIGYAKSQHINNYEKFLNYYASLVRNSPEWGERDHSARKIIKYMYKYNIDSLTPCGMPSIHELILISMLSSTLDFDTLDKIFLKINNSKYTKKL